MFCSICGYNMSYSIVWDAAKIKLFSFKKNVASRAHIFEPGACPEKGNQEDLNLFLLELTYGVEKFKCNHLQTVLPKIIYQLRLGEGVRN